MQSIAVLYYLVALVAALVLLKAYRHNLTIGEKIGKVMLATFLLIVFYSFNLIDIDNYVKSICLSLSFVTADVMMICFLDYIITYIAWDEKVPKLLLHILTAIGAVDAIIMLINPYNDMVLTYHEATLNELTGLSVLIYEPKSLFYIHTGYLFFIALICIVMLILRCKETPHVYWNRYYIIIAGIVVTMGVNILNMMMLDIFRIDISSGFYCVVGILMYYQTFRYLPRVTLQITRSMILNNLNEPIVLFDYEGRLVDYSQDFIRLMPMMRFERTVTTIDDFLGHGTFKGFRNTDRDEEFEWTHRMNGENHTFECRFKCMRDNKNRIIGKIFVFHDITSVRKTYFELERSTLFDPVTGLYNKQSFTMQMPQWDNPKYWPVSLAVCNINGLRGANERFGNEYGDMLMKQLAHFVRVHMGDDNYAAKIDNGDIAIVLEETPYDDAAEIMEAIKHDAENFFGEEQAIHMEYGIATKVDDTMTMERLQVTAHASMQNKKMLRDNSASSSLVDSLRQTLSESDYETEEHVERTREMSARLGRAMGLNSDDIGKLELLAVLHDIGKVAIPHHVLTKKGRLNDEEFEIMKQHTVKGYRIAKSSPELSDIAECILSHHEKWDGTGYPNRLKGEEIPLLARVIACVDSHDVMVHNRPYHQAMPEEDAIAELRRCAGTQFDPHIVEIFTKLLEEEELPRILEEREQAKLKAEEGAKKIAELTIGDDTEDMTQVSETL